MKFFIISITMASIVFAQSISPLKMPTPIEGKFNNVLFTLPAPTSYDLPRDGQNAIMFCLDHAPKESVLIWRDEYKSIYEDKQKLYTWLISRLIDVKSHIISRMLKDANYPSYEVDCIDNYLIGLRQWIAENRTDVKKAKPINKGTMPELSDELQHMFQKHFSIQLRALHQRINNGPLDDSFHDILHSIDVQNEARLKEIINSVGWPNQNLVGWSGVANLMNIVKWSSRSFLKECMPRIEKEAKQGNIQRNLVAACIDQDLINDGKYQIYGTHFKINDSNEIECLPIDDAVNVDYRRAQMGLKTMMEEMNSIAQEPFLHIDSLQAVFE